MACSSTRVYEEADRECSVKHESALPNHIPDHRISLLYLTLKGWGWEVLHRKAREGSSIVWVNGLEVNYSK